MCTSILNMNRTILKPLAVIFFLFCLFSLDAQLGFEEHQIFSNPGITHRPEEMILADLDNDGDEDILISSSFDDQLAWFENIGGGIFSDLKIISSSIRVLYHQLYVTDVDSDGDLDIICPEISVSSTNFTSPILVWFENLDGQGSFSDKISIDAPLSADPFRLFDLDEDGDSDILLNINTNEFGWLENIDGVGGFETFRELSDTQFDYVRFLNVFTLGDIDNDGDNDIVNADGRDIGTMINIDDEVAYAVQDTIYNGMLTTTVRIGDMDNDGDNDIVAASATEKDIYWFENLDGNTSFSEIKYINEPNFGYSSTDLADLNGDGFLDIVVTRRSANVLAWHANLGDGSFSEERVVSSFESGASRAYAFDFDADNDMDIICAANLGSSVRLYENTDGLGNYVLFKELTKELVDLEAVHATDLDGDGDKDILASHGNTNQLVWQENIDGQNSFGAPMIISTLEEEIRNITSFDVDLDGDEDIIISTNEIPNSFPGKEVFWIENLDGDTNWSAPKLIYDNASDITELLGADLDMDGDKDLIITDLNSSEVLWFENTDGLGNFGPENELPGNMSRANGVFALDFDYDSDVDLVVASNSDRAIYLYQNLDSLGTFGDKEVIIQFNEANFSSFDMGDFGNDGDLDILISANDNLHLYERTDSAGSFSKVNEYYSRGIRYGKFGDMDLDGDLDLVCASYGVDSLYWYEDIDGSGDFIQRELEHRLATPQDVLIEDLNLDGMPDILSYSSNDRIVWYENTGLNLNKLIGKVFLSDATGSCENSDLTVENLMLTTSGNGETISTLSRGDKFFNLYVEEGQFRTEITSDLPYYLSSVPAFYTSEFIDVGAIDTLNFCLESSDDVTDLIVTIIPLNELRPGFFNNYRILLENKGISTHEGNILFNFDESKQEFISASPLPSVQSENNLTFSYLNLKPFESRVFDIKLKAELLPVVELGEILSFTAHVDTFQNEITPENNNFSLEQEIIGSFDPNDIRVLEGDEVHIDNVDAYLHYVIRFQNTGTASAINVRVDNVLDDHLDWRSFTMLNTSHPMELVAKDSTDFSFYFDDINLPDSLSNETESHGFICYKIKPLDNTVVGDQVFNQAGIFFDFNPPIITNEVSTEYVDVSATNDLTVFANLIYPNPSKANIHFANTLDFDKVEIYNLRGERVISEAKPSKINLSGLAVGIYVCKLSKEGRVVYIQKLLKN